MTTVGDTLFVDTNVLLTATDESRPLHREATRLLTGNVVQGLSLAVSGQVLREYLVVATRPVDVNGLGLGIEDAASNVNQFLRSLNMYSETEEVAGRLRQLALTHDLHGKRLHDANIVATMGVHGISALVTQNPDDFTPFQDVAILSITDAVTVR